MPSNPQCLHLENTYENQSMKNSQNKTEKKIQSDEKTLLRQHLLLRL